MLLAQTSVRKELVSAYPVLYQADYIEERSRLSVFFRVFLIIPHSIVAVLLGFAAFFTSIAAWLAVSVTGRYPAGLYDFNAGLVRWSGRVNSFAYLQVDAFPPFGFEDTADYPVRVQFAGPLPEYSRLKAFFRLIIAIPVMIVAYALQIVYAFCALAAWFVAVITGKLPRGLFDGLDLGLAYQTKMAAYLFLLTETYPPFSNENPTLAAGGPTSDPASQGVFAPPTQSTPAPSTQASFAPPSERPGGLEG